MKNIFCFVFFFPFFAAAQLPAYVPTLGLLGWYPFSGNANDLSMNGFNGTAMGNASLTSDRYNVASRAYMCGNGNYISVPDNSVTLRPTNIALSAWCSFTAAPSGYDVVVGKGIGSGAPESAAIWYASGSNAWTGNICTNLNCGPTANAPATVTVGNWYHVVYQFNDAANTQSIYLNGVFVASTAVTHTITYDATPWTFGCEYELGSPGLFTDGKVDDIGIWDRPLSNTEVLDLYFSDLKTITGQPVSQTVNISSNATFVVNANPYSSIYQWQSDMGAGFQNLSNGGQYSGVNTATLVVSSVSLTNNNEKLRCVINSSPCVISSNAATLTVQNPGAIREQDMGSLFVIYPNPTNEQLKIVVDPHLNLAECKLNDVLGRTIKATLLQSGTNTVETKDLNPGLYFVEINGAKKRFVKMDQQ